MRSQSGRSKAVPALWPVTRSRPVASRTMSNPACSSTALTKRWGVTFMTKRPANKGGPLSTRRAKHVPQVMAGHVPACEEGLDVEGVAGSQVPQQVTEPLHRQLVARGPHKVRLLQLEPAASTLAATLLRHTAALVRQAGPVMYVRVSVEGDGGTQHPTNIPNVLQHAGVRGDADASANQQNCATIEDFLCRGAVWAVHVHMLLRDASHVLVALTSPVTHGSAQEFGPQSERYTVLVSVTQQRRTHRMWSDR